MDRKYLIYGVIGVVGVIIFAEWQKKRQRAKQPKTTGKTWADSVPAPKPAVTTTTTTTPTVTTPTAPKLKNAYAKPSILPMPIYTETGFTSSFPYKYVSDDEYLGKTDGSFTNAYFGLEKWMKITQNDGTKILAEYDAVYLK